MTSFSVEPLFLEGRVSNKKKSRKKEHCRDASRFVQCNPPDKEMMLVIQEYRDVG